MIVPSYLYFPEVELDNAGSGYHGGSVGPWCDAEPERERRPIGFRMPEREPPAPTSPEGLLL